MISRTRHTGLVVTDISASIDFYESLGLKVWRRKVESGSFISQVVGLDNAEIETAKLKVSDGSLLELIEYKSHPAEATMSLYPSNKHGCSHVAFTVEDIEKMVLKIVQCGGSIVNPPVLSANGLVKVMYCHDLDGILIELVQ
ncbi:MAG: VOC family protein, partial [Gammaproteobacteria bacterium]|nr:VOC family protein [Gammaproteobacteria bacterium]